ncbi:MAG: hypothetical protein ACXWKR_05925 [Phenylobacterium sp.]
MQVSAVHNPAYYAPIQQTQAVQASVGRDSDGDNDNGADDKVKAATPQGVGANLDIQA